MRLQLLILRVLLLNERREEMKGLTAWAYSKNIKRTMAHGSINQSINFLDPLILGWSRGQQLELDPPSILILCHKGQMLCWDAKARPTKIFYVISPSSSGTASGPSTNQSELNREVFRLFFPGTFVSHVHTNAVMVFLVGEAAVRCLEIHEYLHF